MAPTFPPNAIMIRMITPPETVTCIRADSSHSPSRMMITFSLSAGIWSGMLTRRVCATRQTHGGLAVCGGWGARNDGGKIAPGFVAGTRRPHWIDFVAAPLTDNEQKDPPFHWCCWGVCSGRSGNSSGMIRTTCPSRQRTSG